jgi:hypothetical protein
LSTEDEAASSVSLTDHSVEPLSAPTARVWKPARGVLATLVVVAVSEAVLVLAHAVSNSFPFEPHFAYAVGFLAVTSSATAVAGVFPRASLRALWLVSIPGVALWVLSSHADSGLFTAAVVTAALLFGGTLIGACVGASIEHPGQLLFVAIVSAAADLASVVHPSGPSAALAETPQALALLALPWPMLGAGTLEPFLGVGDVVFTGLYAAAGRRHGMPARRTALALMSGYALTMALVLWLERPVPVLPLLGLAVVIAHPSARRPTQRDRSRGMVVVALVVVGVAALLLR